MEVLTLAIWKTSTLSNATFCTPDLESFCMLGGLGLHVSGQRLEPDRAVLECRVPRDDGWCRGCGCEGRPIGTVTRWVTHVPLGWRPTQLLLRVRRYRCTGCGRIW